MFTPLMLLSHQQNNPSNKINAGTPVTKSHIKKFTFCCVALSLTVRGALKMILLALVIHS